MTPDYIYRVVRPDGFPRRTGTRYNSSTQHTYTREHIARGQATRIGGTVQRAAVTWEDM